MSAPPLAAPGRPTIVPLEDPEGDTHRLILSTASHGLTATLHARLPGQPSAPLVLSLALPSLEQLDAEAVLAALGLWAASLARACIAETAPDAEPARSWVS